MTESTKSTNTDLSSLRAHLNRNFSHYKVGSGGQIIFYTKDGKPHQTEGVRAKESGSHVIFIDSYGNKLLFPISVKRLKSRNLHNIGLSIIGLVVSLIAGFSTNFITALFQGEPPKVEARLEELTNIRNSLKQLDGYVKGQQDELAELSDTLKSMKQEKQTLETILSTDKAEVEAIIEHVSSRKRAEQWIERIVSFLIGVFSSLTAAFAWNYFYNIKRIAQPLNSADPKSRAAD